MRNELRKEMKNPAAGMLLLLATALVLVPSVARPGTVLAADAEDSIIKNDRNEGSLTIKKTDSADTSQMIKGVEYTAYRIMSLTPGDTVGKFAEYAVETDYADIFTRYAIDPDELGNYSATRLEGLIQELEAAAKTKTGILSSADASGAAVLNLPIGWYLVRETTTPPGTIAGAPFLVAMPSTDNVAASNATTQTVGTKWIYEIEAAPKSPKITVDKNIVNGKAEHDSKFETTDAEPFTGKYDTVGLGDLVQYSVTATVPTYDESYFYGGKTPDFVIRDTLSDGLTIMQTTECPIEVKVGEVFVPAMASEETANYEIVAVPKEGTDEADLCITFKNAFLKNEAYAGEQVSISYYAQVNENAVMGSEGNTNNVVLSFDDQPGHQVTESPVPDEDKAVPDTYVYTYGIKVDKFAEGTEKTSLSGAKFKLFKDSNLTDAIKDAEGADLVMTTGDGGTLQFSHLDAGTYYLKEVESPSGYSLLTNPVKVELIADKEENGVVKGGAFTVKVNDEPVTATEGDYVTKFSAEDGIATVAIENHKGFSLPATGGSGIFLLVSVSAVGLVTLTFFALRSKKKAG